MSEQHWLFGLARSTKHFITTTAILQSVFSSNAAHVRAAINVAERKNIIINNNYGHKFTKYNNIQNEKQNFIKADLKDGTFKSK